MFDFSIDYNQLELDAAKFCKLAGDLSKQIEILEEYLNSISIGIPAGVKALHWTKKDGVWGFWILKGSTYSKKLTSCSVPEKIEYAALFPQLLQNLIMKQQVANRQMRELIEDLVDLTIPESGDDQ